MSKSKEIDNLQQELQEMAAKIAATMEELAVIRHPMMQHDRVNSAVDEMGAIVAATEIATDQILDAAEELAQLADNVEPEVGEKIEVIVTKIYEASNFQDITGQRITKVTTLLRDLDDRLTSIVAHYGEDAFDRIAPPEPVIGDAALLNGPECASAGGGMEQNSIDSLFD